MTPDAARVIVLGGGIGGLGAACALSRLGVPVTVFEQASELREVGAGIQLWVDGMHALHAMGVVDDVLAGSRRVDTLDFRSWRGQVLATIDVDAMARATGALAPVMVRRHTLLDALREHLPEGALQLGARCVGFDQDEHGVTVRFADGREERGAVLLAFDGVNSVVRRQLFGADVQPRYAGYQYLRAITRDQESGLSTHAQSFTYGRGDRFGIGHLDRGEVYWFGVLTYAQEGVQDGPEGRKQELLRRFRDFPEPVPSLIASTPEEAIGRVDIRALPPLGRWAVDRVTIAGDAAHALTPNLGRGAGLALWDGWTVARHLAGVSDLAEVGQVRAALEAFEAECRPAAAKTQKKSWGIGRTANWRNPVMYRVRERAMRVALPRGTAKAWRQEFADHRVAEPVADGRA